MFTVKSFKHIWLYNMCAVYTIEYQTGTGNNSPNVASWAERRQIFERDLKWNRITITWAINSWFWMLRQSIGTICGWCNHMIHATIQFFDLVA